MRRPSGGFGLCRTGSGPGARGRRYRRHPSIPAAAGVRRPVALPAAVVADHRARFRGREMDHPRFRADLRSPAGRYHSARSPQHRPLCSGRRVRNRRQAEDRQYGADTAGGQYDYALYFPPQFLFRLRRQHDGFDGFPLLGVYTRRFRIGCGHAGRLFLRPGTGESTMEPDMEKHPVERVMRSDAPLSFAGTVHV